MEKIKHFALLEHPDYLPTAVPSELPGDVYMENGLRMCAQCHTPRQHRMKLPDGRERLVGCTCSCQQAMALEEQKKRQFADFETRMQRMRQSDRISDLHYEAACFAMDDGYDGETYRICERYVKNWAQMRENNMGILFYGTVGSGKTFRASCIVNDLYGQMVTGTVTSFPRLLNLLQDSADRQGLLDRLNQYELLVIDDLGAERDSAYALEQVYNIIDSRAKSGKPLIITTNLTLQELKNPPNQAYARIYDRILELCPITLKMTGDSRRAARAKEKRALARKILGES